MPWLNFPSVDCRPPVFTPDGETVGFGVDLQTFKFRNSLLLECNGVFQRAGISDLSRRRILSLNPVAWKIRRPDERDSFERRRGPRPRDEEEGAGLALEFEGRVDPKFLKLKFAGSDASVRLSDMRDLTRITLVDGEVHTSRLDNHGFMLGPVASFHAAERIWQETGLTQEKIHAMIGPNKMSREDVEALASIGRFEF